MAHTIYKNESGKRLKSVTTIINGNLGWKTGALIGWNLKLVDQGLNPREELKKAGRIGTLAHTMIEEFTKGGAVKLVDRLTFSHANFTIAKDWVKG